jgi:L-malate glycosyltransferase
MKIAVVCYPTIGGSGLVATELGVKMARLGHEVHFISYASPFKLPQYERNISFHSVDAISYPLFNQSLYTLSLTAKIIEVTQGYNLDLVHAHYSIPHSLCAYLAREVTGLPFRIITTLHGTDVSLVGQDKPLFPINRFGIEKSDMVTTVSQFQADLTRQVFGITKPIEVIYNFVDTKVFRPGGAGCCRSNLAKPHERVIMHVSNYRQPKNALGVLAAFHLAQKRVPARLVLVGDGPDMVEVRSQCKRLGICDKVQYVGKMDNVETILPHADVLLQPSYREAFGMVLLEAMACGVPTVSSNIDGIPEVVVEGETGFMAGPDDHQVLADRLVQLCEDDDLRTKMGAAGRARAITHFEQQQIVPKYLNAYERLLA